MKQISETIVFFGSGPVGSDCLKKLSNSFNIEAVITKPKAPHHRGIMPVITTAKELNIPIFTASNKLELDNLIKIAKFKSRLAILIDFGIIVSSDVIKSFKLGIVNSHFSLLPRWRGADPITYAILKGDEKTGVSLMLIDEGLDTGKLIAQRSIKINNETSTPELTNKLILLSDQMLKEYVPKYIDNLIKPRSQPHPDRATYSSKIQKIDGKIDWSNSAQEIQQQVRAFLGWPGSYTNILNKDIIITKAIVGNNSGKSTVGKLNIDKSKGLLEVQCGSGTLVILKIKPAGKREMPTKDFLVGYYKS